MDRDFFPNPEFDDFLYASVGDEDNGMQLSVLSALARQNVDAWDVARQLVLLPKESAIRLLTSRMAMIPAGAAPRPAPEVIAARLIALLPKRNSLAREERAITAPREPASALRVHVKLRLLVAFTVFALISHWLFADLTAKTPTSTPAPARTAHPSPHDAAPGG